MPYFYKGHQFPPSWAFALLMWKWYGAPVQVCFAKLLMSGFLWLNRHKITSSSSQPQWGHEIMLWPLRLREMIHLTAMYIFLFMFAFPHPPLFCWFHFPICMRAPVVIDSFEDHCLYTHLQHLDQAAAQDYDSFTDVCIDAKNQNNLNFFLYTEPVMSWVWSHF